MKNARVVFIVFGIVLLIFVIAPYASAQGVWFKGKASMKGYEVSDTGTIVGKANGNSTIYVNMVDNVDQYNVTTCIEDSEAKGVWHLGTPSAISKVKIYGDPNSAMIWDFAKDTVMNFFPNVNGFAMFYVKTKGTLQDANFKSFSCNMWDNSNLPAFYLGSCGISFKGIDAAEVPTDCIP